MALWNKPYFAIGSTSTSTTDLTSYVRALSLTRAFELNDDTASGDTARSRSVGLEAWGVSVEFNQDSTAVDAVIDPLVSGQAHVIVRRSSTSSASSGNPEWSGTVVVENYNPHGGSMGDHDIAQLDLSSAGNLTRSTTT